MAVNRTKVLEAAQKFLSKGQYDKAIAEYQKLVQEDPRDVRTLLKIGDLHTRRNKPRDAVGVYDRVADLYAKQGFFLKAVAVYKQILKLDPSHLQSLNKLASMYEELALTNDALTTYEQVADAYLTQGEAAKSLEVMQRMIALDGDNIAVHIKYAEALSRAGKQTDAAAAFARGAALLKSQGRMDDYLRVVERQLFHAPDDVRLSQELANLYLERRDPKRALAKLQTSFKADPRNIQTLEMLAEAFNQLGQSAKTISVLKEIARLHGEVNDVGPRRRTLERVLSIDPGDAEARQALAGMATTRADTPPPAAPEPSEPAPPEEPAPEEPEIIDEIEIDEDDDALLIDEDDDALLIVDEDEVAAEANDAPAAESSAEKIAALLEEADEQETAEQFEAAEQTLRRILMMDSGHLAAHERLKDLFLATDRRKEAAAELIWLSKAVTEQSPQRAEQLARAAHQLAPEESAVREQLRALNIAAAPAPAPRAPTPVEDSQPQAPIYEAESLATGAERPSARSRQEAEADPPEPEDLLDIKFGPADFSAPPPPPRDWQENDADVAALLERSIDPDEFGAVDAAQLAADTGPENLLDEPISPEEFDAQSPQPDDFGLGDDHFYESESLDLDAEEDDVSVTVRPVSPALEAKPPTPPPWEAEEVPAKPPQAGPEDGAVELLEQLDADSAEAWLVDNDPTREGAIPEEIAREWNSENEADAFENDLLLVEPDDLPEPTVPAAPVPDLLRQSSASPPDPEPASPVESEPPLAAASADESAVTVPPAPPEQAQPVELSPAPESPAQAPEAAPQQELPPEVEEALDEAEFFASQGLLDEALEVVQEAILIYPDLTVLKERLANYEAQADALEEQADAAAAEPPQDDSFDIAKQLAAELAESDDAADPDDLVDVESVFAQFKAGVAEQVSPDDTDTHFDLGIAYKEMGLVNDAIREFELSAQNPKRACNALTMIGTCHLEKGDPGAAIEWFEKALAAEHGLPTEELALHYELGNAHEQVGQLAEATRAFEKVVERDRRFRDAASRLSRLQKGSSGASSAP